MVELELRLFGPPRVRRDGRDLHFDTRKAPALLSVLAVSGREHSRDSLAGMLWPELDRTRARAALRRTLSVATAVGAALEIENAGARLDPAAHWCDVSEFQRLAAAPDTASWRRAAELADAGFLEGFALRDSPVFEDWQIATADALRDALSQLLSRLVADAVARGALDEALRLARRRTQIEPLSEPAHADLIRVTAWSGDRPGALQAYRALVRLLARELGVPPLPETLALHEAVRAGTLAAPAQASVPAAPAPDAAAPAAGIAPRPTLVGRDALLDEVVGLWRSGGAGGFVGEPGIGKSALLSEAATRVGEEGGTVLRLSGHVAEQSFAYAAANDLVRAMLALEPAIAGDLGSAGELLGVIAGDAAHDGIRAIRGPGDLERVHESVRAAVAAFAARRRTLLAVDDAHLLDAPSSALLAYIVRRSPPGLATVAAWTGGAGPSALREAVAEVGRVHPIPSLGRAEIAALIGGAAGRAQEVLDRTRGIALLVSEYVSSGRLVERADAAAVREMVAARFEAAAATTRQVVCAAAVIGSVADPELLRAACGRDESETVDAIEEAIARGLLVERADRPGYDVPHDVVSDVALSWLSLARGRLLHGRVAEVLARRHAIDALATPAGAVARHLAAAGHDEEATQWHLAAAEAASRLYAHAEALEQLDAARSLGHRPAEVHEARGATLVRLGRYTDALVSLDQAAALAEGDPARQSAVEHALGGVYDRLGDQALALVHLEAARDLAPAGAPATPRILADLALAQLRSGLDAEAGATATEAGRLADASESPASRAHAGNVLGLIAASRGDLPDAERHFAGAAEDARAVEEVDLLVAALNNLSRARSARGDAAGALDAARTALEWAERHGDRHRLAVLHSHLADLLHAAGREDEAVAELKASAAAFAGVQESQIRPEVWTLAEW